MLQHVYFCVISALKIQAAGDVQDTATPFFGQYVPSFSQYCPNWLLWPAILRLSLGLDLWISGCYEIHVLNADSGFYFSQDNFAILHQSAACKFYYQIIVCR